VKLLLEKDGLLKSKDLEIKDMKDKVLRSYAEMENVIARTKRESENTKKYGIQVCVFCISNFIQDLYHILLSYDPFSLIVLSYRASPRAY
jgi:molecular chaperone GrpE (heat shock protein)